MFVDPSMKPVNKIITESNLDFIFNMDDESIIVSTCLTKSFACMLLNSN